MSKIRDALHYFAFYLFETHPEFESLQICVSGSQTSDEADFKIFKYLKEEQKKYPPGVKPNASVILSNDSDLLLLGLLCLLNHYQLLLKRIAMWY